MSFTNPVLSLPAFDRLNALDDLQKIALEAVLRDLGREARVLAEQSWRRNKGPMAAYWKAVSVYANHTARALRVREYPEVGR